MESVNKNALSKMFFIQIIKKKKYCKIGVRPGNEAFAKLKEADKRASNLNKKEPNFIIN